MARVVPRYDFGGEVGRAFGTGLGQGLQSLAQMQLQQMQQRRQVQQQQEQLQQIEQQLEPVVGAERAQQISRLYAVDPVLARSLFKRPKTWGETLSDVGQGVQKAAGLGKLLEAPDQQAQPLGPQVLPPSPPEQPGVDPQEPSVQAPPVEDPEANGKTDEFLRALIQGPGTGMAYLLRQLAKGPVGEYAARAGARGIESAGQLLALPGQLLASAANVGQRAVTGEESELLRDIAGADVAEKIKEGITKPVFEELGGKGFIDPKSNLGVLFDDVVGTAVPMMMGIPGIFKGLPAGRAALAAGAGAVAKMGAKKLGFAEGTQEVIKLGTMIATGLVGPKGLEKVGNTAAVNASKILPPGVTHAATKAKPGIRIAQDLLQKNVLPSALADEVNLLSAGSRHNRVPVEVATEVLDSFRNAAKTKGLSAVNSDRISKGINSFKDFFESYGKINPEWFKQHFIADSILTAVDQTKNMLKPLTAALSGKTPRANWAFGGLILSGKLPTALVGFAGANVLKKGLETMSIIAKSSVARKIYENLAKSTLAGNIPLAKRLVAQLDRVLGNLMKKEPKKAA